ncbi:hypothetical protein [Streptomyces sp. NPDC046939]|uniref:hypothetical protein n=1 Tax=Streptomyces sp. NPDC046939 TaxID=3155376 RepID=UPI0033E20DC0
MSEQKNTQARPLDNQMPVPPADEPIVTMDNQMPAPPADDTIVTMDNQMPAPPVDPRR